MSARWEPLAPLVRAASTWWPPPVAERVPKVVPAARRRRWRKVAGPAAFAALFAAATWLELKTSWLQSKLFSRVARQFTYSVQPGDGHKLAFPRPGPADERLGYARLPQMLDRLRTKGYAVESQARLAPAFGYASQGLVFPIYREKSQAGLRILDRDGRPLFVARYPNRVYATFEDIPPIVVQSLLFIENREALDQHAPTRNPAVEWDRFAKAFVDMAIHQVYPSHPLSGGSTLATQLEKVRHSPNGRTASSLEKLRQMTSASLRAYLDGPDTRATRRRIVRDYINSIPLAAVPGFGEVNGLGDGLWAWYGADFRKTNSVLAMDESVFGAEWMKERALAYRQALSLLLALNRPAVFLTGDGTALNARVDAYLRLLAQHGIISGRLRDEALAVRVSPRRQAPELEALPLAEQKGIYAVRAGLLPLLGAPSVYALDRMDMTVHSTLDGPARQAVLRTLAQLADTEVAGQAGLLNQYLLAQGDPASVIYSFNLWERSEGANLLRIQADNYGQPLDINEGTKLELGSTAKLRTLVTYLEVIAELHARFAGNTPDPADADDRLSRWAIEFLTRAPGAGLEEMLEAALLRQYSASPGEAFFTGGGLHTFSNFDKADNGRVLTVREAFQRSVNLVFIRLMRDIVQYHAFRVPGASADVLRDPSHPARRQYLERFADQEGRQFLRKFYNRHRGLSLNQSLQLLGERAQKSKVRRAVVFRSVAPEAPLEDFTEFVGAEEAEVLYEKYGPSRFGLNDRGYLAGVHPLELWLVNYLNANPGASFREVEKASHDERQEVYGWLFKSRFKAAQDSRIRTMMESDAFQLIHKRWQRLGFPFSSLVPSYATSIGSSGDNPAALAELAGILVNDGWRYPSVRVQKLHFAEGTPMEVTMARRYEAGERVLPAAVARAVRQEMFGVVEMGTGRRLAGGIAMPDGARLPVGGKTGTGDNRRETYASNGAVTSSRVVSRTATFVFIIGDRYFGTITAYVPGEEASDFRFTSALPVQVFKHLTPSLFSALRR